MSKFVCTLDEKDGSLFCKPMKSHHNKESTGEDHKHHSHKHHSHKHHAKCGCFVEGFSTEGFDIPSDWTYEPNVRYKAGNLKFTQAPDAPGVCDSAIQRCVGMNGDCVVVNYNSKQNQCLGRSSSIGQVPAPGDAAWTWNNH
jgi:hypothetical protein